MNSLPYIPIVLSWTFVAVFVFTSAVTCGMLVGWVNVLEGYRDKLFYTLLMQVVAIVISYSEGLFVLGDQGIEAPVVAEVVADNDQVESDSSSSVIGPEVVASIDDIEAADHMPSDTSESEERILLKTWSEIREGDLLTYESKSGDGLQFTYRSSRPKGLFGRLGSPIGVVDQTIVFRVHEKYVTPTRKGKWLGIEIVGGGSELPKRGWVSWENQRSSTFRIDAR